METFREVTKHFGLIKIVISLIKQSWLQKTISVRHGAAGSRITQEPTFNWTVLGTGYIGPSNKRGEVANPSEASNSCKREHNAGHTASTKANTRTRAEIWNDYRRCNRANRTGSSNPQQSVEASMGIEMPRNHGGRCLVWRKTMAPMRSEVCFTSLLSIGTEGRRLLKQKFSHDSIYDLSTLKLWEMMEIAFFRTRNITFDCYVSFSRKQKKDETIEQFYSILKELAENSDCEDRVEMIIRDIFITNMLDDEIQRELHRDTVDPDRALSLAVNMEMRHQTQQRICLNNNSNNANGNATSAIQSLNIFRGAKARVNQSGRISFNRAANGQCRGCGQSWTSTHRQVRPALGKKCNHWGLLNHFAKVSRKKLNNTKKSRQDTRIKNVESSDNAEQLENQIVNFINKNEQYNSEYDSSDDNYVAMVENFNTPPIAFAKHNNKNWKNGLPFASRFWQWVHYQIYVTC